MIQSVRKWLPAFLLMAIIFALSSRPSTELPFFGRWDVLLKKSAHALGYAGLALACWHGFDFRRDRRWAAWLVAVAYSISDEYHQSFVPGRHASWMDVLLFDHSGVLLALWLRTLLARKPG